MSDSSRDCPGRWRFRLPAPSSNRLWRFGKARRLTCWRPSKLWFIEPGATGRRAVANIMPRWKGHEHENQFKGFPGAARSKRQTQRVADDGEALLQVEEAVSKTPGRTR